MSWALANLWTPPPSRKSPVDKSKTLYCRLRRRSSQWGWCLTVKLRGLGCFGSTTKASFLLCLDLAELQSNSKELLISGLSFKKACRPWSVRWKATRRTDSQGFSNLANYRWTGIQLHFKRKTHWRYRRCTFKPAVHFYSNQRDRCTWPLKTSIGRKSPSG